MGGSSGKHRKQTQWRSQGGHKTSTTQSQSTRQDGRVVGPKQDCGCLHRLGLTRRSHYPENGSRRIPNALALNNRTPSLWHLYQGGELAAICIAVETASAYPDSLHSQDTIKECRTKTALAAQPASKQLASSLRSRGTYTIIEWIPGHSGIPGNKEAHHLVRVLLILPHRTDE